MPQPIRLGGFGFQVRLVLALLVLFLATLDGMNLWLLSVTRDALAGVERARLELRARHLLDALGPPGLAELLEDGKTPPGWGQTPLRHAARRLGFGRLALLDRAGRQVAGTERAPPRSARFARLDEGQRQALATGRTVWGGLDPARGGEDAQLVVFHPLVAASGRTAGVFEASAPAEALGLAESRLRLLWAIQGVGVLVIFGLALLFANWVSRPYRRLAAAVGESGWTAAAAGLDPDDLASAFRAVALKLREQDQALGSLEGRGGGLGDLVRFASAAGAGMATGLLVLDRQMRIAALNPAAAGLLDRPGADVRGLDLEQVSAGVPGLAPLAKRCLQQGTGVSREVLEWRGEAGAGGHLGVAVSPAVASDGHVSGLLVLMTDLTEIRAFREQARLRESLAAVGQLSAGIAHEFRNALGTILGYARMLEKQEDPRVRGPAREILREVDAVRTEIDEFLLYARPPEPSRTDLDLGDLVRACARTAPAALRVEVHGEYGIVTGDDGLLRRAFGNLLQNCADAAADLGRDVHVRVTGRMASMGRVQQVDVEDDGPGIPPERRAQVFVPFFTTRARGTGLGLALVQRTIVDLGGTIEVVEGSRGGALFRLRFPLKGRTAATEAV